MALELISPRTRGFICTSSHPEGCAQNVAEQIEVARAAAAGTPGGGTALVIGASTGYGLASRIAAAFGHGMRTVGVFFEKPASDKRTASAGWYNSAAFHTEAASAGLPAASINGDAFSDEIRSRTIEQLRDGFGPVDLLIYSLASPVRTHPETGELFRSVLKPVGEPFTAKSVDLDKGFVSDVTLQPATPEEIAATIAVMGGDDLRRWVDALLAAGLLAPGARVVPYSYIGPEVTWPIYRSGTIGQAKADVDAVTRELDARLQEAVGGRAWVSVNKAVVTQASAAIPTVPLYLSILYPVMRELGLHERPIEQMVRLLNDHLAKDRAPQLDTEGRIRMDDWEMRPEVQAEVTRRFREVTTETLGELADLPEFQREFRRLFGFDVDGVDYSQAVETQVALPGEA